MAFSPLTNTTIPNNGRYNPRNSAIRGFMLHHNAGINAWGEQSNPRREVSANYWISNDGRLIGGVDETLRAWTSGGPNPAGAQTDHKAITYEVSNSAVGGNWPVSAAAIATLVKSMGEIAARLKLGPITRANVWIHSDVQATACPGPYMVSILGNIISQAEAWRQKYLGNSGGSSGGSTTPGSYLNRQIDIDEWWNYKTAADAAALRNKNRVMPAGRYTVTKMSGNTPHLVKTDGKASGWVHPSVLDGRVPVGGWGTTERVHTVVKGDTLYSIAKKYGTTVASIQSKNGLGSSTLIRPGQKLKV